jgi:mannose/fructose/N-acetylgalactosamine-specific phosphotransferase system component IIB
MKVQLLRIDDRLIHGQVVLSWAKTLQSKRILLCDDGVAANDWEKQLYLSCVPGNLHSVIFNVREAREFLSHNLQDLDKTIILVKAPSVLLQLIGNGFKPDEANLGGMHYAEDRRKYLSYIFLAPQDVEDLRTLIQKGISIYCQEVPTAKKYDVLEILNSKK